MNQNLLKAQIDNLYGLCDQIAFTVGVTPLGWGHVGGVNPRTTTRGASAIDQPHRRKRSRRRLANVETAATTRGRATR